MKQKSHSQYGYGYPFFISQKIDSKGGRIKVFGENSQTGSAALSNQIITLVPIIGAWFFVMNLFLIILILTFW